MNDKYKELTKFDDEIKELNNKISCLLEVIII